jgi:hypothetical protein
MKVHFDADLLVYRCGFAAEKQQWQVVDCGGGIEATYTTKREAQKMCDEANTWPDDQRCFEVTKGDRIAEPVENALHNVRLMIDQVLENLGCDESEMTLYLSGSTNFRDGVATLKPYKGNRDAAHKPVHGPAIREYMKRHYDVIVSEDEEADDVVGYSHYAMWLRDPYSSVIVTVDKDIDMIPGMHYNFIKEDSYYVSPEKADRFFYMQLLMGDATDNIPGIPGCGPKKAAELLEDTEGLCAMQTVVDLAYKEAYGDEWEDALVENGRLLWIRRHPHEWWSPELMEVFDDDIPY